MLAFLRVTAATINEIRAHMSMPTAEFLASPFEARQYSVQFYREGEYSVQDYPDRENKLFTI